MSKRHHGFVALFLFVLAFAFYGNSIPNKYALDDELVTIDQRNTTRGIEAIPDIFTSHYFDNQIGNKYEYRPVVLTTFAIEHELFGVNPHVSHAVNVLIYGLLGVLLYLVLRALWPQVNWLLPALISALFLAHPLHTEVVASIKNRDEMLCLMGGLGALFFALRFVRRDQWLSYLLFFVCFLLAVMSKRSILSYIVLLPVTLLWFNKLSLKQLLLLTVPMSITFVLFSPNNSDLLNMLIGFAFVAFPVVVNFLFFEKLNWKEELGQLLPSFKRSKDAALEVVDELADTKPGALFYTLFLTLGFTYFVFLYFDYTWVSYGVLIALSLLTLLTRAGRSDTIIYMLFGVMLVGALYYKSMVLTTIPFVFFAIRIIESEQKRKASILGIVAIAVVQSLISFDEITTVPAAMGMMGVIVYLIARYKHSWIPYVALFALFAFAWRYAGLTLMGSTGIALLITLSFFKLSRFIPGRVTVVLLIPAIMFLYGIYDVGGGYIPYEAHPLVEMIRIEPEVQVIGQNQYVDKQGFVPAAGRELDFVENPLVTEDDWLKLTATPFGVMAKYVQMLVAPVHMRFYYGYDQAKLLSWAQVWPVILPILYFGLLLFAFVRAKRWPIFTFGLAYLLLALLFISNFGVLVAGMVAERLAFIASLGFCILLAYGLFRLFKISEDAQTGLKQVKPLFLVVVGVLLLGYGARTVVRNMAWEDAFTLYRSDIDNLPRSAKANQLMGYQYSLKMANNPDNAQFFYEQADKYLKQAIKIYPRFHSALFNLGNLHTIMNNCQAAIPYLERSLQLEPYFPDACLAYASCMEQYGQNDEAIKYYERVLSQRPDLLGVYTNLSFIYFQQGDYQKAIEINKRALQVNPQFSDALINIGKTYITAGQASQSIEYFERAYPLSPNDINLVQTLLDLHSQIGDPKRAAFFRQREAELLNR